MRRLLGFLMVGLLLAGTAAACSSDDDGGGGDTTTTAADSGGGSTDTTAADSGDSGGGNEAIAAYCDSVQEFVAAGEALAADPTDADAQQTFTDLGTQLATDGAALAGEVGTFSADDAAQFQECQTDFSGAQG